MRILITGAGGMLGQDVCAAASAVGHDVIALARAELDIVDAEAVDAQIRKARPDVVINCAAYTNVDGAEADAERANAVNASGAGNVARAAASAGAWTIHISSDYVFDGAKRQPYVESDPAGPLSEYGRSKLAGEIAVAQAAPVTHSIVRSSWLFGAGGVGGSSFPKTILRLAAERDELSVVEDQVGCPTFTGHLARALIELSAKQPIGVLHVVAAGHCSWYEFASEIVERAGLAAEVRPGRTENLGRPAPRPAYSVLGTERQADAPPLPDWREGLAEYLSMAIPAPPPTR